MRYRMITVVLLTTGCARENYLNGAQLEEVNRAMAAVVRQDAGQTVPSLREVPNSSIELFGPTLTTSDFLNVSDNFIEEACIAEVDARIRPEVVSGKLSGYAADKKSRARRTCVVMSACDTVNGVPDYFAIIRTTGSAYAAYCRGVTNYGPALIESEREIFQHVLSARDLFRDLYSKEGYAAAKKQADISVKKPDSNLDLQGKISPFTIN